MKINAILNTEECEFLKEMEEQSYTLGEYKEYKKKRIKIEQQVKSMNRMYMVVLSILFFVIGFVLCLGIIG